MNEPTTVTVQLPSQQHDIDTVDMNGRESWCPGWESNGVPSGVIVAYTDGVSVEGELFEDGAVDELERTAHKVLAAVAWHRHFQQLHECRPSDPDSLEVTR